MAAPGGGLAGRFVADALGLFAAAEGHVRAMALVALSLRLLALLLCLLAALRPSVVVKEKKRQGASIVFLLDDSTSMLLSDEVGGKTRWDVARRTLDDAGSRSPRT